MVAFLGPFIALLLLIAATYALSEQWDQVKYKIFSRLIFLILGFSVLASGVYYTVVSRVACLPACVNANLVGRDLSGLRLNDVTFAGANLSGADLSKAHLVNADLSGANLDSANLEGADLRNARLLGASLAGANLAGAELAGAAFNGADMERVDLTGVDLTTTVLLGTQLSHAELVSANLTGVDLVAVDLMDAKLNGAKLVNANLSGALLSRADLSGALMAASNLSGAWLNLATLIGVDLTNADMSGASFIGANLASANLVGSRLVGATLVGAAMSGANLNGVNMLGARLLTTELTDEDLILDEAVEELNELQRSQLIVDATWEGATFDSQTVWPTTELGDEMLADAIIVEDIAVPLTDTIKVGILHSLSGPMAISEVAVRDATLLAIDEINAAGGVLGKQLEAVVQDGASEPEVFADKARKLLEDDGVAVIFGGWTSFSRKAMLPVLDEFDSLLFFPAQHEGFENAPSVFYLGPEPSQQVLPAVRYLLEQELTDILLVGSDYLFSRTVHTIIRAQLMEESSDIVGEIYTPLGEGDFSSLIEQLRATPPDAIINTMYGESNVAFFQQLAEAGITAADIPIVSTDVAEEEVRIIGPEFVAGHFVMSNYFQTLQTPENFAFVAAYKKMYGDERVTSAPIQAAYASVYIWKALVDAAQSTLADDVRDAAAAETIEFTAPDGPVQIDAESQHLYKYARIGIVGEDGLINEVISSEAALPPDPFLTAYPWGETVREMVAILEESE